MTNRAYASAGAASTALAGGPSGSVGSLADGFPGSVLDATKWSSFATGAESTSDITVSDGDLILTPTHSGDLFGVGSAAAYDLVDSQAFVRIAHAASTGQAWFTFETALPVSNGPNVWTVDTLFFACTPSTIEWGFGGGGTSTTLGSATFDPVAHKWLRIRESGGTIYWETSPDTIYWTVQAQHAAPFSVASGYVVLAADTPVGTSFSFSDFNVLPGTPGRIAITAAVLDSSDEVVGTLSAIAAFSYGDSPDDIRQAIVDAVQAVAGDPALLVEFISG